MNQEQTRLEQEEVEDIEEEKLINLGTINISQMIKSSQTQNGLKHSDYTRYRRYCVQKVKRIRKILKFSYGKKYNKKNICLERKNDPKILQVLLYNAEKNWAYAMDIKNQMTHDIKKQSKNKRMKFHLRNKFKKAVQWSKLLLQICEQRTEKRSSLEAEAYSCFLEGVFNFEIEKWEAALQAFLKSRSIYSEILKISDSMQGVLYKEKIEQIEQSIRYCNHKASKGKSVMTIESILEMKKQIKDPTLNAKLEELLDEHRQEELELKKGLLEITYHNELLPIKNSKVLLLFQKIQENNYNILQNTSKIYQLVTNEIENSELIIDTYDQNLELFISSFSLFDDIVKLLSKDKEDPSNSEAEKQIFVKVLAYFQFERQTAVLERNDIHIKQAIIKFIKEDGADNLQKLSTKKALKLKLTTPQEIVKYCDNYQQGKLFQQLFKQVLKQIQDVERMNPDLNMFKKMDIQEFFCKAIRCFFVSCLYFSNSKYQECASLLRYSEDLLKISNRKYQENITLFKNTNMEAAVQAFPRLSAQIQLQCKLNALKEQFANTQQMGTDMNQLSLEQKQDQQFEKRTSLFSLIQSQDTSINLDNVLQFRTADLTQLMQPITPKPITFDLAFNQLHYPQLEVKEQKKPQVGGFWGKLNIFKK